MQIEPIEQLRLSQQHLADWQAEEHQFIPLSACANPNYVGNLDLEKEVTQFLMDPKLQVLLLAGHSGAGKSLYTQGLVTGLWAQVQPSSPLPLWISLPSCNNPENRAIEEAFERAGLDEAQIEALRLSESFIFILDAYDEIRCEKNLTVTNRLARWKAKTIITCRHEYLYGFERFRTLFTPSVGGELDYDLSSVLYVKPFNPTQIEDYIKRYLTQHPESEWPTWERYEQAIEEIPGVKELIKTPYVLKLAMEALPEIARRYEAIIDPLEKRELTRATLYDVFMQQWFARQEKKLREAQLISAEDNLPRDCWVYAKALARLMHQHNTSQVSYEPQDTSLFDDDEDEENPFAPFFDRTNPRTSILQSACLLREVRANHYAFLHASLIDYFLTRGLYDECREKAVVVEEKIRKEKKDYFNEASFCQDTGKIHLMADRIPESNEYKEDLLARVYGSKNKPENAIGAANAITVLVRAGVTFNGADLSGIHIPGANLSGGYFDRADLSKADLRNTQMHHMWLREASLAGSQVEGMNFGEYPWFKHEDVVWSFDYREDLQRLVTATEKGILLWDTVTGEALKRLSDSTKEVNSVAFSPDGQWIVSGADIVALWAVVSGEKVAEWHGHEREVTSVVFSSDAKWVAWGSSDKTVRIWEVGSSHEPIVLRGHNASVDSVAFSPEGTRVASGGWDKTVRIWGVASSHEPLVLRGHEREVNSVAFSPEGTRIASGSKDKTVRIWEVATGEELRVLRGNDNIYCVAFSRDGKRVMSGASDKTVTVWEVVSGESVAVLRGHQGVVNCVQFSVDGERAISAGWDKTVRIWDIDSGKFPARLRGHRSWCQVAFSPNGEQVASVGEDQKVLIWHAQSGQLIAAFNRPYRDFRDDLCEVAFSPDGAQIVWVCKDNFAVLALLSGKERVIALPKHRNINRVAFSVDGKRMASAGDDHRVLIHDIPEGNQVAELVHKGTVQSVNFSPGGLQVVSGCYDGTVQIWEVASGKALTVLRGHESYVGCVQFSLDAACVVSGGEDRTVRIWEIASGGALAVLRGHENDVTCVAFSRDGERVISGSRDRTIRLWTIATEESTVLHLHDHVRNFSTHANGSLVVGFTDGSLECYQNLGDEQAVRWQLRWSSDRDSRMLYLPGLNTTNVIGLTEQNRRLLVQRGADFKADAATKPLASSSELITHVARRSGSPLHQSLPEAEDFPPNEANASPQSLSDSLAAEDDSDSDEREITRCARFKQTCNIL